MNPREEGTFPSSHWKSLQLSEIEDGGNTVRKTRRDQSENIIYASPWDIVWEDEANSQRKDGVISLRK